MTDASRYRDEIRTPGTSDVIGENPARANGYAADWQAIGTHRDAMIWVRERRTGCWVAAVVPMPTSAAKKPALISPSEEMVLPAECESQTGAVEAAKRFLDGEQGRRVRPTATPGGEEGAWETAPAPEVRRYERIPVCLPAIGWAPQFSGMALRGVVRYIAAGGLMIELPVEVVSGSTLRVRLQSRQGPREVEGKVVWTAVNRAKVHHGLVFPEPQDPQFLEEFFREENR